MLKKHAVSILSIDTNISEKHTASIFRAEVISPEDENSV
jgi:hypothetical protein